MDIIKKYVEPILWKPNPKQELFLSIPFSIKEAFYGGGAGSGKSDVLMYYGIVHRFHENPKFKQLFLRQTFPEIKNEIWPRTREVYERFGAHPNKTDMTWTFPRPDQYGGTGMANSGAIIQFGHCETEDDVHNYDSMEISLFTPDELTSLTEFIYLYIAFERNRTPKGSGLPALTRAAGMPGGRGHTFAKKRFVDPFPSGGKILQGRGGNKRIYVHATLADNPYIDPTYSQSLEGRPDAERKAKKFGDWSAYLGQVFDEFRDKRYPDEPENALHIINPFEIPKWWPRMFIGDWGFAAMCYIGYYAISPIGRMYLYRERHWFKTKIAEWAPLVKQDLDIERPKLVKFCQSAGQDRGQDQTIAQQISEKLGVNIELTVNSAGSRIAGKSLLHEYLRWKPIPILPPDEMPQYDEGYAMWIMRNKSVQAYKDYLRLFDPPEPEVNLPKFLIFRCEEEDSTHEDHPNCCPLMIDSIKACNYDKKGKDGKSVEDVAEFEGDDPYDDVRYACQSAEQFISVSANEFKKVQERDRISKILEHNNDWTAFYRNMRSLEATQKMRVVSRFHKRRH